VTEPAAELARRAVAYVYEEGGQPCGYCWGWSPPDGWDMENVDQYLPRGDGWIGLADTHPECWQMVEDYMEDVRRNPG
jgi:hypothetical protein